MGNSERVVFVIPAPKCCCNNKHLDRWLNTVYVGAMQDNSLEKDRGEKGE